jgi:signal transduction histidine kinase
MGGSLETSHDELRVLVEEQAALRRVATLVARAVPPADVFDAVCGEVGRLLEAPITRLLRCEPDGTMTILAGRGELGDLGRPFVGVRFPVDENGAVAAVLRTGRVARLDDAQRVLGPAALAHQPGLRSAVAGPIVVQDRLWGVMTAGWLDTGPLSAGGEGRLAQFTELVATAIANADSRVELAASRARIVAAADETRRRIERDLHDGTQQSLVSLALDLRTAEAKVPPELVQVRAQLARTADGLAAAVDNLREISRGIHPAILSRGGLAAALNLLARRSAVPVQLDVSGQRPLPDSVQVAVYYVVSEALTNVAKHAHASVVRVHGATEGGVLRLSIADDGVGGAEPGHGTGLIGLRDRIEALGGRIEIASPWGNGTTLLVALPVAS